MLDQARRPVFAKADHAALPLPGERRVEALTDSSVLDRWAEQADVRAVATGDNIIQIFSYIGEDYWSEEGGITAKKISAQLRAIGDRPVEVHINSGGGNMFEGIAIYNVLREHPQDVTVKVMGVAASAASIIAMAGNEVQIGSASFLMIHNCWVVAVGNRHDMKLVAAYLEPFDVAMRDVYAAKSGRAATEIAGWLDDETWMSGSTAIERGLADALLAADQLKTDPDAKARTAASNELRALELTLVRAGRTRTEARATIAKMKGTPGAARTDDTPGAVATIRQGDLSVLRSTLLG